VIIDRRELSFMHAPVRQFFQRHYEFRAFQGFLRRWWIDLEGKFVLDVGCGSGYSSQFILEEARPGWLSAFDIMPEEIEAARQRRLPVNFFVADATRLDLADASFDAAFVFAVLHHVAGWRDAVRELARVLRPGGVLLIEEPDREAMQRETRWFRLEHPEGAGFTWPELVMVFSDSGFHLLARRKLYFGHFQSMMFVLRG
jgi:ubiquinone/menaquinone biosynthesis C-methylase UbiE